MITTIFASACLFAAVPTEVPPLMRMNSGAPVADVATWEKRRRPEILRTFEENIFGRRPVERPDGLAFETIHENETFFETEEDEIVKVIVRRVKISWKGSRGNGYFVVNCFYPPAARRAPAPCFVFLSQSDDEISVYRQKRDGQMWPRDRFERYPVARILSRGYATVAFNLERVAEDTISNWRTGVFDQFQDPLDRDSRSWGTLSAWAWGASRVMDYLETEPLVDKAHVAVAGLSRRGKTALWAGATDRRFAMACSGCSGTCGAKLNHVELPEAESLCRISRFRHWFCRNFDKWAGKEKVLPFDQHWMLALMAPRLLCVASASEDAGAGPEGEFLAARLASPAWELYGKRGIAEDAVFPPSENPLQEGWVSYHIRKGGHNLLRYDWDRFLEFADRHGWRKGAGR